MKKRILALIALGAVSITAIAGCTFGKNKAKNTEPTEAEEPGEEPAETEDPGVEEGTEEDVFVVYYGCPRSKRLKALNTKKREA